MVGLQADRAQQVGGASNDLPPAHGLPRGGGRDAAAPTADTGDSIRHGNGPATPDEDDALPGGALAGETDYLEAHTLVDWDEAPFAATAWGIGRPVHPDAESIARWLWVGADGNVTGTLAPNFGVVVHPGRGMTLRRPGIDGPKAIQRPGLVIP